MKSRLFGRFHLYILVMLALTAQSGLVCGQDAATDEAAKRLEFLKARFGANALPQATPSPSRKHFADTRSLGLRPIEPPPAAPDPAVTESHPKAAHTTDSPVVVTPSTATHAAATPRAKIAHAAEPPATPSPSPAPRIAETATPAPHSKTAHVAAASPAPSPTPRIAAAATPAPHSKTARAATSAVPSPTPHAVAVATPTPAPKIARATATPSATPEAHPIAQRAPATPAPAKTAPPARRTETLSLDTRITDIHPAELHTTEPDYFKNRPTHGATYAGHYPWKTEIVTTVFWIGEPVGGHNFTPNYASSWDSNWTRAYGGYDNPNPEARHNYIPVNFTPHQNPFYCALPYNDVTRGTTKPEARVVIPWFRDAFRREGQSVCRDRWVCIRSRTGRVVYAQWSDCGPFRTDHWQYVFGSEKPRPNLNQGAGLDVSPAVRDYLGLQPTDVTDWKFVDEREVPNGPWALYGDNNTCLQRGVRLVRASNW